VLGCDELGGNCSQEDKGLRIGQSDGESLPHNAKRALSIVRSRFGVLYVAPAEGLHTQIEELGGADQLEHHGGGKEGEHVRERHHVHT
jgi:hypothetical protein